MRKVRGVIEIVIAERTERRNDYPCPKSSTPITPITTTVLQATGEKCTLASKVASNTRKRAPWLDTFRREPSGFTPGSWI